MWTVIVVDHCFITNDQLPFFIQSHGDGVVRALLPVLGSGRTTRQTGFGGGVEQTAQLSKFLGAGRGRGRRECGAGKNER